MNPVNAGRGLFAIATFALCMLVPSLVRAESEPEKKQQAREHYEKATRLYDVGKYGEAISEYEEAYLLIGDAALLFNIGQAYRLWDHSEDAIRAYKNFLRQRPDAANRADVEKKIADLERVVEDRRRGGTATSPADAYPPPVQGASGTPPGAVPVPVAAPPMAASGPQPGAVVVGQSVPAEPAKPAKSWLTYPLLGLSGACLITAGIAGAVGASKAKKLQDASQKGQPFDPAVQTNGKTANLVAFVSGLAGLAAGGVGGYLLWRDHRAVRATVAIVPTLAPSFAGGSAWLTF